MTRKYAGENAEIRTQHRRLKLIDAGKQCFGQAGFSKTKIKDICIAADLTERYFYESFKNKEELLGVVYVTLMDSLMEELKQTVERGQGSGIDTWRQLGYCYFSLLKEDKPRAQIQLFEILGVSDELNLIYQKKLREVADLMMEMIVRIFPSVSQTLFHPLHFTALTGAFWQLANEWVLSGYEQTIPELLEPFDSPVLFLIDATLD